MRDGAHCCASKLTLGILDRNPDLYIVWSLLVVSYITIFLKVYRQGNLQTVARDVVLVQVDQGIVNFTTQWRSLSNEMRRQLHGLVRWRSM